MDDKPGRHVVAACGEALIKVPATDLISASYSTRNFPRNFPKRYAKSVKNLLMGKSRGNVLIYLKSVSILPLTLLQ